MKRTAAVCALVLAAALPAFAAQPDFQWSGRVASGDAVEIKDVNGRIDAVAAAGDAVEVTAIKRARRSNPDEVKIEVVEHAGGVTICALYPSPDGTPNVCAPGKGGRMSSRDNDVEVQFQVKVPAGVRFVGRTVNGRIAASGLTADADAETVNGAIELESTGTARACTVNGSVTARLGRADWTGTLLLRTVNGRVEAVLPASLAAEVKASTVNGDIETDFPLTVRGRFSHRHLSGTVGAGGRVLEMETVNGSISLRKAGSAAASSR